MASTPELGTQVIPLDQEAKKRGPVLGRSGLKHWAGYISEEFLVELRGLRAYKIYDEMRRNEPTVAGLLTAIEGIIQHVHWEARPDDDGNGADLAAAEFVNKALHRIDRPIDEVMSDVCTMFPFGWALLEVTYKYQDGRVWWDSIDLLGQDSLFIWGFDDRSKVVEFIQRPAPTYEEIHVPIKKCLLFRTKAEKGNPEGISMLRAAYKPYFYKKTIEEIEAMGAERDLLGIPVMDVPFGATAEEMAEAQSIVENIKNDDQAGVVLTGIGPDAHQRFNLRLLTGQGSSGKVSYTDRLIARYAGEIAMVALAQFIALSQRGGYKLDSDIRDLFQVSVDNWMGKIADVWNRQAIPNLLAMNGMTGHCTLGHGRITQLNLQTISNFITSGVQNRFLTVDRALEDFLRREAELPPLAKSTKAASEEEPAPPPLQLPGSTPGNPATPPVAAVLPVGKGAGALPTPGSKDNNSGLNANPGANQQGAFQQNAASDGKVKIVPGAGKAANELAIMLSELDDSDIWQEYAVKTLGALAGDFWSDEDDAEEEI